MPNDSLVPDVTPTGGGGDDDPPELSGELVPFEFDKTLVEGIPENFIKTEGEGEEAKQVIDLAAFTKSWKDQQSHIKNQAGNNKAPEKPEDYAFEPVDDDMKAAAAKALRVDDEIGEDPIVHAFREFAHEKGVSKGLFQDIIGWFVTKQAAHMDEPIDPEKEKEKLGADWEKRTTYIAQVRDSLVANGSFDADMVTEMKLAGQTAAGVKMMETLIKLGGGSVVIPNVKTVDKSATREELQAELRKITEARDKGEISEEAASKRYKEVQDKMTEIVGDGPGGTSVVFADQ